MEYFEIVIFGASIIVSAFAVYFAVEWKKLSEFLANADAFLEKHAGEVPEDMKGMFEDLKLFVKDSKEVVADGKVSFFEAMRLYKDGMALFDEVKEFFFTLKK